MDNALFFPCCSSPAQRINICNDETRVDQNAACAISPEATSIPPVLPLWDHTAYCEADHIYTYSRVWTGGGLSSAINQTVAPQHLKEKEF